MSLAATVSFLLWLFQSLTKRLESAPCQFSAIRLTAFWIRLWTSSSVLASFFSWAAISRTRWTSIPWLSVMVFPFRSAVGRAVRCSGGPRARGSLRGGDLLLGLGLGGLRHLLDELLGVLQRRLVLALPLRLEPLGVRSAPGVLQPLRLGLELVDQL